MSHESKLPQPCCEPLHWVTSEVFPRPMLGSAAFNVSKVLNCKRFSLLQLFPWIAYINVFQPHSGLWTIKAWGSHPSLPTQVTSIGLALSLGRETEYFKVHNLSLGLESVDLKPLYRYIFSLIFKNFHSMRSIAYPKTNRPQSSENIIVWHKSLTKKYVPSIDAS